jgi:AraC family transcriptional regulator, transcriptional activator of pobA
MSESYKIEATASAISPHLRAEYIQCGLRPKVLGLASNSPEQHWRAVLLLNGDAILETNPGSDTETESESIPLSAPCLAWVPWRPGRSLRILAGGVGFHFSISEEALVGAIGNNPESVDLRLLVDRRVIALIDQESGMIGDVQHAFDLIVRELQRPRNGSWNLVLAQVRSVLVFLWRLSGIEEVALQTRGQSSRILQRFRQLLEMNFQARWAVGDYADALSISHDRLHDICRRNLDKTPRQLIHDRTLHEARLRLERSTLTVEQVALSVGFRDVGHFSRFFKSKVGMPPGKYRDSTSRTAGDYSKIPASTYADWP